MCREPLHQLRLGHSHLTQSLFSNEARTILCTHRDGCSKEMVNGKHRAPTCKANKQNPTILMISVVKDGMFLQPQRCVPWSSSSWLLLSIPRKIWPYSSGQEQNSNLVEWFPWMACHLCTIRKPVSWLSPTIQIYLKRCRFLLWAPTVCIPLPSQLTVLLVPWVSAVWKDYWCSFLPVFACTLSFCHRVWF